MLCQLYTPAVSRSMRLIPEFYLKYVFYARFPPWAETCKMLHSEPTFLPERCLTFSDRHQDGYMMTTSWTAIQWQAPGTDCTDYWNLVLSNCYFVNFPWQITFTEFLIMFSLSISKWPRVCQCHQFCLHNACFFRFIYVSSNTDQID